MHIPETAPLFAWNHIEDDPSLKTIKQCLKSIPDGKLLGSLRRHRGRGRNDYPVHVLWGTTVLTILLRHRWVESCLAELRRNEGLRRLIGIESEEDVPKAWNMTRFLNVLGTEPHLTLLREVFDTMVKRLSAVVPDLGENCAGDATSLLARSDRSKDANPDGLPEPNGGRKQYYNEDGEVTQEYKWFGFNGNIIVDTRHEVIMAWQVSSANTHDNQTLPALVEQAAGNAPNPDAKNNPTLPGHRIKTLAYDKAADDAKVHAMLDAHHIKPVIKNRKMWKDEQERMLPGHDGTSNIVHDELGTVYCYDTVSQTPVRRQMAFIGHEPARRTLKYRCPARHRGFKCASDAKCNCGKEYGKTIRVKRDIDLRRFPPIPRATKQFQRLYKGRTAVERVNARLKLFWGSDDGNITGATRFHAFFGTVMIVHISLATVLASAPRRQGTLGKTRLSHIAKQLQRKIDEAA